MEKFALITGATAGIGQATARLLASKGYRLALTGRREDSLHEFCSALETEYKIATLPLAFDVRNREAVIEACEKVKNAWGRLDILINNAGLALGLSTMDKGSPDDWDVMIDTNIKGLLYMTRYCYTLLRESPSAHIVNVGSIAGKEVYMNGNVYCSTKHAVDALSKSMRLEFAADGIKVSAVHPGAVETEFSIVRFKGDTEKAAKVYEGFDNLLAEDIAEAVWFMLSRPDRVNINEMVVMPKAQPIAGLIHRKG